MNENEGYLPIKLGPARKGRPRKHGGYSVLYNSEIPYARKKLMRYFREVRTGLIEDLGGPANVTTGQLLLIDRIIFKLGFLRLVEVWIAEKGTPFAVGGRKLEPIVETYLSYANSLRNDLNLLGIEKKEIPEVIDLKTYIQETYGKKSAENRAEKPPEPRVEAGGEGAKDGPGGKPARESGGEEGSNE